MDSNNLIVPTVSDAETWDVLSHTWCNFAIQALQPESHDGTSSFLDTTMKMFKGDTLKMGQSTKMDGLDHMNSMSSWKSNELESWTWMQQAMHPELNYSAGFQKNRWMRPFGIVSIKKWVKMMKEKTKAEKRLQKAEVHAAVSIAGLAAALAAIAKDNPNGKHEQNPARRTALASGAAIVAHQCAQVAESMGATRGQLSTVISSALSGTSTSDILTLTAAASTSLRGAATLKARARCKNSVLNGSPVSSIDSKLDDDLDFERCRSILAKGATLNIEMTNGKNMVRLVSVHLNNVAKVILKIIKCNLLNIITSKKECLILNLREEKYKESGREGPNTCYQIVLTTSRGTIKLHMANDYQCYKMWATTINQMLMLSPSLNKYELQLCKY